MTISSHFDLDLKALLREIEGAGFLLTLVGGAPRDYLLDSTISQDLDFEVRNQDISVLKKFFSSKKIPCTALPYDILRVPFNDYDLEFSLPRLEKNLPDNKTHHHFEATLIKDLSYEEAFKRRDFTINAIGIELNMHSGTEVIRDPYGGVEDLKKKVLKYISTDFFLDSVRFLRLIRFSIKYSFTIDSKILKDIGKFNLLKLSKHHFLEEMMKSKAPGFFINKFNELVELYKLEIWDEYLAIKGITFDESCETKEDLLVWAFFEKKSQCEALASFLKLSDKKLKDLKSFEQSFKKISNVTLEMLQTIAKTPLAEIKDFEILKELKNLEEKKEWRKYFLERLKKDQRKLLVSWEDWEDIKIENRERDATPQILRSYIKFHKALQRGIND